MPSTTRPAPVGSHARRAGRLGWSPAGCMLLLLLAGLQPGCRPPKPPSGPPPEKPAPVKVAVARQESEVTIKQTYVGTVMPWRTSIVGSPVEGRVVEFLVNEGDRVRGREPSEPEQQDPQQPGQGAPKLPEVLPLARLRTEALEIDLAGAESELKVREHELKELEASMPKEIEQATSRKEAAEALKDFTQSRLDRTLELRRQNAVSDDELEERQSAALAAASVYLERLAAWELAESGLWDQKIKQAEARRDAQQEAVNRLKDDIRQHEIYAPFDGYVTKEYTEVGQWIAKGDPVAEVVELDRVYVAVPVLEGSVSQLRAPRAGDPGTLVDVEIGALPGRKFTGEVVAVVPKADLQSRSFPVQVRLANPANPADPNDLLLKPGMFARVTLPVDKRSMLLIPKDALVFEEDSDKVWVAEPAGADGAAQTANVVRLSIETGISVELAEEKEVQSWIEVRGPLGPDGALPLRPGQLVVWEGNERLRPGQKVSFPSTDLPGDRTPAPEDREANAPSRTPPK